ncbi:MAG: hypothetical protein M3P98_02405 [bacterium]|nr:hypothetical protein [bacterium]
MEEHSKPQATKRRRKISGKKLFIAISILLLLALAGTAVYYYKELKAVREDPSSITKKENSRLVEKVSELYNLPDEEPAVATVIDKTQLGDQPFFANAENDDKILIFTQAKLAVIYREKDNKIISVGPIAINQDKSATEEKPKTDTTETTPDTSTQF